MDYLRKCYVTRVRPYAGSDKTAVVRWFWAPEGAPVLRGAIWRSSFWYVQDLDGRYPAPPAIGEERSVPFRWSPGRAGQDLAIAKCTVGDPSWFATGIPPPALLPNPPPTPACCRITPGLGLGGLWLGGLGRAARLALGGLRLGGRAVRKLLGASGGLKLGGVAAVYRAEGGWRLGGQALQLVYVTEGGLLLGGEAQELMALLYCAMRAFTPVTFPDNSNTAIPWDTIESDPSGMWNVGDPTHIKVPVGGVYLAVAELTWPAFFIPAHDVAFLLKGVSALQPIWGDQLAQNWSTLRSAAALVKLAAGEKLAVGVQQQSGIAQVADSTALYGPSFRVAGLAVTDVSILSSNVYKTGGQSITSGVRTAIIFDTVNIDTAGMWAAAHPTRMTAPSAGTYLVQWAFGMGTGAGSGKWSSLIAKNGSAIFDVTGYPINMNSTGLGAGSYTLPLAAGDYVEVMVFHNLGSALTLQAYDGATAWVSLTRLGATG